MGPINLKDIVVGADMSIDCGEVCQAYRVVLVRSGEHRGLSASAVAGTGAAAVYAPEGRAALQWDENTKYSFSRSTGTPSKMLSAMQWADR
jgi:hypothetical protein